MKNLMPLKCMICGTDMQVSFTACGYESQGICGKKCYKELEWRRTLSILNKPYRPDNQSENAAI